MHKNEKVAKSLARTQQTNGILSMSRRGYEKAWSSRRNAGNPKQKIDSAILPHVVLRNCANSGAEVTDQSISPRGKIPVLHQCAMAGGPVYRTVPTGNSFTIRVRHHIQHTICRTRSILAAARSRLKAYEQGQVTASSGQSRRSNHVRVRAYICYRHRQ